MVVMVVRLELPRGLISSWPLPVITKLVAFTVPTVIGPAVGSRVRVPGPLILAATVPVGGVHCVAPTTVRLEPMLMVEVTGPGPMFCDRAGPEASKTEAITVKKKRRHPALGDAKPDCPCSVRWRAVESLSLSR